jgi:hypothetical protein
MNLPVVFDEVMQALSAVGSTVTAAEAHGCLCGALCARRSYLPAEWMEEVIDIPDEEDPSGVRSPPDMKSILGGALGALYASSRLSLASDAMEFMPLLPDDEADIGLRVEALAAWCHGFLYGFGSAGTISEADLDDELKEILGDLAELSRAGQVGAADLEAEEVSYAELVEYVRVGVQIVHDQLAGARARQPSDGSTH